MTPTNPTASQRPSYGVTEQGFVVKPFKALLDDAFARARALFGPDVDLRSSSALRKVLELATLEHALLWMALDDVYHSGFAGTAVGDALDLLGGDLGLARAPLLASGTATLELTAAAPKDVMLKLPPGSVVETDGPEPVRFALQRMVELVRHDPLDGTEKTTAPVVAVRRGPAGDIAAGELLRLNATFAGRYLNFPAEYVAVTNAAAFVGGKAVEDDTAYRSKLQRLPRSAWTADAVRETVLALDGVRDALVSDPFGGLDRAAPPFGAFCFGDATFQQPRELGNPYFFTVVVARKPGVLWESGGDLVGLRQQILDALQPVRPISIFPDVVQADSVEVALRVRLILRGGADAGRVRAAARAGVANYIGSLRFGDAVLAAQVLRVLTETPGVRDVQGLHLRRCPTRFGMAVYGEPLRFRDGVDLAQIELGCGVNLVLAPREVAVFAEDSPLLLIDLEVASS